MLEIFFRIPIATFASETMTQVFARNVHKIIALNVT